MRDKFLSWGIVLVFATWITAILIKAHYWIPMLLSSIYVLGVYNAYQTKHAILRNFPVLGYFRYFLKVSLPKHSSTLLKGRQMGSHFQEISVLQFTDVQKI